MTVESFLVLAAVGATTYVCRVSGFFAMRFVSASPKVAAALDAAPLAAMIGIIMPSLREDGATQVAGCAVILVAKLVGAPDTLAALLGVVVVAVVRAVTV